MSKKSIQKGYETEREVRSRRRREQEEWASHGGYMHAKVQKLINKYDSDKSHDTQESQSKIFENVAIFVNGYTEPSFDVLRQHMIEGGGRFEHYYSATRVTHIIATSLALSKQRLYESKKVVLPAWITDSVEKGQLQPYDKYLLMGKNKITNFFSPQTEKSSLQLDEETLEDATTPQTDEVVMDGDKDIDDPQPSTSKVLPSTAQGGVKSSAASMLSADQPGFMAEFYGNSRLHHISHWRTHLKDLVNEIRADPEHQLTGRDHLMHKYVDSSKPTPSLSGELSSLNKASGKVYMHLDMDCFFVSVALRTRPELTDRPVVVAHSKGDPSASSNKPHGSMSQIASCNYIARQAGVRNGMMMGKALSLCPDLQSVPYDFEGYSEVSTILYQTVASYTIDIEAVSCDELYIDITSLLQIVSHETLAEELRQEIKKKTGCPCSAGMGSNLLLARLATRLAKPDGQYYVSPDEIEKFISTHKVNDLPGVGRVTGRLLEKLHVETCAQLQTFSLAKLKEKFGAKNGESLYKLCRGQDDRLLRPDQPRQSVSCDVNYGIRLIDHHQVELLFNNISSEVCKKLKNARLVGKQVTLKLKVRSADAPVKSAKFMGHGICDSFSKSSLLNHATADAALVHTVCLNLWRNWKVPPADLRGVGIQITKLEQVQAGPKPNRQTDISTFVCKVKSGQMAGDSTSSTTTSSRRIEVILSDDDDITTPVSTTLPNVVPEIPSLCGYREVADIKNILDQWIHSERDGPSAADVSKFTKYLKSLVECHHLDIVQTVTLHLCMLIRHSQLKWKEFYSKVKSTVQETVHAEYNLQIKLDMPD